MGQLSQRDSVHGVGILILFVNLAKTEKPKVRMSEDKKANVPVYWGVHREFAKCHSFGPPGQFCVRAATGGHGAKAFVWGPQGSVQRKWSSNPGLSPASALPTSTLRAEGRDRHTKPGLPSLSTALGNEVSQLTLTLVCMMDTMI